MPPKRKAPLSATTGNHNMVVAEAAPAAKKVAKGRGKQAVGAGGASAAATTRSAASKTYKYSDPAMIKDGGEEVNFVFFKWPVRREDEDEDEDEDEEEEEEEEEESEGEDSAGKKSKKDVGEKDTAGKEKEDGGEKKDSVVPKEVTDEGFPITRDGLQKFMDLNQEVDKRDQDCHGMYIYNRFSAYGVTEVMENLLAEFNGIIYKKDVSATKKWALIEGLATYLELGDLWQWMRNDDSEGMEEILNMFATMFVTSYEMLHESGLLRADSPIPNVAVMTLFFLSFITGTCSDFEIEWPHEIVRALDKCKFELKARKEIDVSQDELDDLRDSYKGTRAKSFNWKTEYARFKKNHPGGHHYDITKMSAKEKARFTFGTKENDAQMKEMIGTDEDLDSDGWEDELEGDASE